MRVFEIRFPVVEDQDETVYGSLVPHAPRRIAALYNFLVLEDGSTIELVEVEGKRGEIVTELDSRENLRSYSIFASSGDIHYIYQLVDQDPLLLSLLDLLRDHRLIIDFPIRYGSDGVSIRIVGEEADIQSMFESVPEPIRTELEVERITDYTPETHELRSRLTRRQREVLEKAAALGYYSHPRQATITDLAEELGISQSTVSEHLRRIEATVLGGLT